MIAAEGIPEGFRPASPEGSLREVWEPLNLGTPASPSDKRKGPLIFRPAGLCCNPAEVQTKLARAAAFDHLAADKYFATSRLNKVGFAAGGQKEKSLLDCSSRLFL
jgi:hypothetical protein